ncbi:DUF3060 domain-containing protein [Mycobacterium sp. UM_WGJ]|uniref:DUF3060 domain-containing protein n=1 Tax=Mycobacterium sp. UM_WGJ TaxID=1370120 RepID=UPI000409CCDC|nr:DUF3060 domain-containing protein [Mycobacterium sp. UM_WGJ]
MNADDDPEARIRELERPLSDFAAPVELTSPSIGTEGRTLPPRGRGIAVVAIAAALLIGVALAMFLIVGGQTTTTQGHPTATRGAAPEPSTEPVEVPAPEPAPIPEPPVAASPANPVPDSSVTLTIAGAGENKILACDGRYVSVSGVSNTVELTGQCAGLTVSGIGNVITVDSTPKVTASGLNNRVTYRSGNPDVSTSGFDNVVERG